MSPRISFSHDLLHFDDVVPVEQRPLRSKSSGLNSSIDFDFCVGESFEQEPSPADELFSDGKILPSEIIKKKNVPASAKQTDQSALPLPLLLRPPTSVPHDANINENSKKERSKGNKMTRGKTGVEVDDEKQSSKSFWGFQRSGSLNCGSGYGRSLCPSPLFSRSNSTGSTTNPNVKQSSISKDSPRKHKQNSQKHTTTRCYQPSTSYQKPPLKKSYKPYGNGVQVNPVLNVPSGNLFGLGSIFFNGKDNKKKKKKK